MAEEKKKPKKTDDQVAFEKAFPKKKDNALDRGLKKIRQNIGHTYEVIAIALFTCEGFLAAFVGIHEGIPAIIRLAWHTAIAAACLVAGVSFMSSGGEISDFVKYKAKYYSPFKRFLAVLGRVTVFLAMLIATFLGPVVTFLLMASLSGAMDAVMYAYEVYGIFGILGWYNEFEGNILIASTYTGTLIHYVVLLIVIASSVAYMEPDIIPPTAEELEAAKKKDKEKDGDKEKEKKEDKEKEGQGERTPRRRRRRRTQE